MSEYAVVVNDCAAPGVRGLLQIRTHETAHGRRNFALGFDDLAEGLPGLLGPRQLDWLETLGHLFAIDMACQRGPGDVDWSREIQAWLPVREPDYWRAERAAIERIWTDLTDDELQIHFEDADDPAPAPRMGRTEFPEHDSVALVSGGQDSFVGALDLVANGGRPLLLSHIASGATNAAQNHVEGALQTREASLRRIRLSAAKARGEAFPGPEPSQRSRTFLYVGAAAVVAAEAGAGRVFLNENGIMALHVPLTPARVGSLSTHTASPPIVARMESLASRVLGTTIRVENRLVGLTKPEVVGRAVALGAGDEMQGTVSCWQIGRTSQHCGICTPCLLRRIACEQHAIADVPYAADVFDDANAIRDGRARDNLTHLVSLVDDLASMTDVELQYEYPELQRGGPALTLAEALDLHRRWASEATNVLFGHPVPTSLR